MTDMPKNSAKELLEKALLSCPQGKAPDAQAAATARALAGTPPPGVDKLAHCRSCNAPIYWVSTIIGKKMPVDAVPVEASDVGPRDLVFGIDAGVVSKQAAGPKYSSHFSNCPNADEHRKARAKS